MWGQQVDFSCCMILKSSDRSAFDYLILILASVSPLAVWQRVGRERMIHAISCLVNTPGTRLTLNSLMPTCPFYQPTPLPSSFLQSDRGLFFLASEQFMSSCVGRITSQSCDQCGASILIFGCLCVTRAVFWPERGKGKLCPSAPPSSCQACCKPAKPALRQPARGNLDMV